MKLSDLLLVSDRSVSIPGTQDASTHFSAARGFVMEFSQGVVSIRKDDGPTALIPVGNVLRMVAESKK